MQLSKLMLLSLMILTGSAHAQEKPNIVFVFMDNFGYGELAFTEVVLHVAVLLRESMHLQPRGYA